MNVSDALPSIHSADKNLHPLGADDLYLRAGSDHDIGRTGHRAPEFAANADVAVRREISLRDPLRTHQSCRASHTGLIGAPKKGINQQVFE